MYFSYLVVLFSCHFIWFYLTCLYLINAYVFRIISFCFLSCILFYVACAFVICLIKYLLTYLLRVGIDCELVESNNSGELMRVSGYTSTDAIYERNASAVNIVSMLNTAAEVL